jgi:hypothetical protein
VGVNRHENEQQYRQPSAFAAPKNLTTGPTSDGVSVPVAVGVEVEDGEAVEVEVGVTVGDEVTVSVAVTVGEYEGVGV